MRFVISQESQDVDLISNTSFIATETRWQRTFHHHAGSSVAVFAGRVNPALATELFAHQISRYRKCSHHIESWVSQSTLHHFEIHRERGDGRVVRGVRDDHFAQVGDGVSQGHSCVHLTRSRLISLKSPFAVWTAVIHHDVFAQIRQNTEKVATIGLVDTKHSEVIVKLTVVGTGKSQLLRSKVLHFPERDY